MTPGFVTAQERRAYVRGVWEAAAARGCGADALVELFRDLGVTADEALELVHDLRAEERSKKTSPLRLVAGEVYVYTGVAAPFDVRLLADEPDVEGNVRVARLGDDLTTWVNLRNLKEKKR